MISTSELDPVLLAVESRRVRLERLLQIASGDFEMRLEFGERDRIGEGQLILGIPSDRVADASYAYLVGSLLHLFGHYEGEILLWSDAARRYEGQGRPFFSALWHALEDARLENQLISRWPGSQRAFDSKLPPNLKANLFTLMPRSRQLETGLYLFGRGFEQVPFSPTVLNLLKELKSVIRSGTSGGSPRASLEAAQEIYPKVAPILRASEVGERLSTDPTETQEQLEPADSQAEPAKPGPGETPEIIDDDQLYSVDVTGARSEFPEWYRPGSAPWFERGLGAKAIHPSAVRTDRQTIVPAPKGDPATYRTLWAEVQADVGYLTRRLTNRLREEVYLRFGGYYRSGKINMAKLWKQRLGNFRLFQRATSGSEHWIAISLLVDESASMKGQDKYVLATKTALLLGETLEQLGIPFEVIGFTTSEYEARAAMSLGLLPAHEYRTTRCSPLEHRVYKHFDEPYRFVRRRLTGIEPRHNNWDEEHLHFAFRRLQSRSEERKLMIIVSDGQPNGDADHLIETVRFIERLGTRIIAIGVGADYVCEIYSEAIVVKDFRQLAEDLFQLLTREISGGVQQTEVQSSHYAFAGTAT